jgi:hypothetical protein
MSDVLNSNMVGRGSLVHSSGFPAASGSGPSLNPAGVEVVVEPEPPAPPAAPVPPAAPIHQDIEPLIQSAKGKIYFNLTTLYGSMDPEEATELTDIIFKKKGNILEELKGLNSPVNGQILWQDGGDTIRNPQSGQEYQPNMLDMILDSLRRDGRNSHYYKRFLNDRMHSIQNADLSNFQLEDLPMDKLDKLNQAKLLTEVKWRRGR